MCNPAELDTDPEDHNNPLPTLTVTTSAVQTPGAPTLSVLTTTSTSVILTWTAPTSGDAPTSYTLQYKNPSYQDFIYNDFTHGLSSGVSAFEFYPSSTDLHYFRIYAENSAGQGAYSNVVSASETGGADGYDVNLLLGVAPTQTVEGAFIDCVDGGMERLAPGKMIPLNDGDADEDGTPDMSDFVSSRSGHYASAPITGIGVDLHTFSGSDSIRFTASGLGAVNLWKTADRTGSVDFNDYSNISSFTLNNGGLSLWMEGVGAGSTLLTVTVKHVHDSTYTEYSDSGYVTVYKADMTVYQTGLHYGQVVPDAIESKGEHAPTPATVNDDYDDHPQTHLADKDDAIAPPSAHPHVRSLARRGR